LTSSSLLRGEQAFWQGQQVTPPEEFDKLIRAQIDTSAQAPTPVVPDPGRARDAVLAYLSSTYGDDGPSSDLDWDEDNVTAEGLVGSSSVRYTAHGADGAVDWVMTVTSPVVAPDSTVYHVVVDGQATGFHWEGAVDAAGRVSEPSEQPDSPAEGPDADRARDAALAHLAGTSDNRAPMPGLNWTAENITPEDLMGSATIQYTAKAEGQPGQWVVTVTYPIVLPEDTNYQVVVANDANGFYWEGKLDAHMEIVESSSGQRERPAGVTDADLQDLSAGNSAFALDLYQVLRDSGDNLFYSPYSISLALAMTYTGARNETEQQMADTLHYPLEPQRLPPAFSQLDRELASRGEGAAGKDGAADKDGGGFRLNIVNALWGQESGQDGFGFLPEFLELLIEGYQAPLRELDFAGAPEESRVTINDWISENTEGRIEDLIPQGIITALTRLVLTNAIYFNAAWATPFEEALTTDGAWHLLDGGEVTVPMMRQNERMGYARGDGLQALELPYDGHEISMVILLPDEGQFEAFEDALDAAQLDSLVGDLSRLQVGLTMPKFEFESDFSLKEALSELGMPIAFDAGADFSGMTGSPDLFIAEVLHKAFVAVDEAGTEAAAATAVVMMESAMAGEPLEVTVDRPFIFLIRDLETGTILFMGRVLDPSP
jgi:serpin B